MSEDDLHSVVDRLRAKYANDPYMLTRLSSFMHNQLPNIMESMDTQRQQRAVRTETLNLEFDSFIKSFMTNNKYFYVSSTEKFFYYDGMHYKPYNEDGILHHILTSITNDRNLMSWKYKTKVSIMKRIKENPLLTSVPESDTIQHVIMSLYPTIFSSKNAVKYFLTILGDNILKKKTDLIHLLPAYAKSFIRELNNYCQINIGVNLMQSFRLKYHEHDYTNCRLVYMHEAVKYENIWKSIIEEIGIDLICVAVHYSTRYDSSDECIADTQDTVLQSYVSYLSVRTVSDLVGGFVGKYIAFDKTSGGTITWKNLQYLWKHFLNANKLPMVLFQTPLKNELVRFLGENYIESTDTFQGIFSKYLPDIQRFIQFWDETMIEDESESGLELEEIRYLYNKWGSHSISDEQILDLIQYFYPNVNVEREKYIQEIRCSLWDKKKDLACVFTDIRTDWSDKSSDFTIYDAYLYYCKRYKKRKTTEVGYGLIVHKSYFENYAYHNLSAYIVEPGVISKSWFTI